MHEIRDWDDLRRRIDPPDRRCFVFFHPALIDEPLIFVEVALNETIRARSRRFSPKTASWWRRRARIAASYSISNTERGLGGVSFGNFLIKQVVEEFRRELPSWRTS